jgi:hypothetical protein
MIPPPVTARDTRAGIRSLIVTDRWLPDDRGSVQIARYGALPVTQPSIWFVLSIVLTVFVERGTKEPAAPLPWGTARHGGMMKCRLHIGKRPETVIFLCEESGNTARPWRKAGFSTICVDLSRDGQDVRLIRAPDLLGILRDNGLTPYGLFAMPPCTHLAGSGARWWRRKGDSALLEALSVSDACLRIEWVLRRHGLQWAALENPVGRLSQFLGEPTMTFQPCEFGDPYTKRTCLWGDFNPDLHRQPVAPTEGSRMWNLPPSPDRASLRSKTPEGFAQAFCAANRPTGERSR